MESLCKEKREERSHKKWLSIEKIVVGSAKAKAEGLKLRGNVLEPGPLQISF